MSRYRGFVGDVEGASREGGGRAVVFVCPLPRPSGVAVSSMREMSSVQRGSVQRGAGLGPRKGSGLCLSTSAAVGCRRSVERRGRGEGEERKRTAVS